MSQKIADTVAAQQSLFAICKLEGLSVLPCVFSNFLSGLQQFQLTPSKLTEIIESDPALVVCIHRLLEKKNINLDEFSIARAVEVLSLRQIRDAFLSCDIYKNFDEDKPEDSFRKQLLLHAVAVGCCAKDIARISPVQIDSQMAYYAGLLHNIGNLALDEQMPRSFARIIEQAKSERACICDIEKEYLGTDYTVLGKRLAQRWQMPSQIIMGIWLHQSNTEAICQTVPEARIAEVVQLADSIVRQCGIGQSGSYDLPVRPEKLAQSLEITGGQIDQIIGNLKNSVSKKSKLSGLQDSYSNDSYCEVVLSTAAQLSCENTTLSEENLRLQTTSSQFGFIADFLAGINTTNEPIEIAGQFAVHWQEFYQTGMVCLYLPATESSRILEAVIVEAPGKSNKISLKVPDEISLNPGKFEKDFQFLEMDEFTYWLLEQLDVDFELSQTKILPLICKKRLIGAVIFEFRYPVEEEKLLQKLEATASAAGTVLEMAFAGQKQQFFAEQFAALCVEPDNREPEITPEKASKQPASEADSVDSLAALTEMAAGAAHELNNPLSVISGRTQLLSETETDAEKKKILAQINQNAGELSGIINDLMGFAKPQPPNPQQIGLAQILNEAVQLTSQKTHIAQPDIQINIDIQCENVFVDSGQVVSAIANVFCNSIESYADSRGQVKVVASKNKSGNSVKLVIIDFGCGMNSETVRKATQPFFSAKPAGRKRGMGLAYAQRFMEINGGSLNIISQIDRGTTVVMELPCS